MNLCLMGRQCLHRQHGCNFSQEGIDDATQKQFSLQQHILHLSVEAKNRERWRKRQKTWRKENNNNQWLLSLIIHIIATPLPKTHLHESKKTIYHSRPKFICVEDWTTQWRLSGLNRGSQMEKTKRDKETTAYGLLPQSLSAVTPRLSVSAKLK